MEPAAEGKRARMRATGGRPGLRGPPGMVGHEAQVLFAAVQAQNKKLPRGSFFIWEAIRGRGLEWERSEDARSRQISPSSMRLQAFSMAEAMEKLGRRKTTEEMVEVLRRQRPREKHYRLSVPLQRSHERLFAEQVAADVRLDEAGGQVGPPAVIVELPSLSESPGLW